MFFMLGFLMTFGQKLKQLLEKENLKPEELAKNIQFTKSVIWSYENGTKEPSTRHLIRLADYFNVSTDYLLCREKQISVNLENLVNDNNQKYLFRIESKELSSNELKEVITYIKVKRMMELEQK
ncbi:helix-turn-helix transcriptional regulator [Neobacillus drentensis]|uniref:helix-turn-helix domain-containing protein n=1 Tax=Neobacillus drentensis TaxID=220684 RepID=UPI002FFEE592